MKKVFSRMVITLVMALLFSFLSLGAGAATDFISTPSEEGSPAFHHHLVRPGTMTTYLIRLENKWDSPVSVKLELEDQKPAVCAWSASLTRNEVKNLGPGEQDYVVLKILPDTSVKAGDIFKVTVKAATDKGQQDQATVTAEASLQRKIYFVSIDSLHPAYLKLNAAGTGMGKDGDWFMPHLHRLMKRGVFYPNALVDIITATDMNHFNYLAGTNTGTSGIGLVGGFLFGFDEKGKAIIRSAANLKSDMVKYGPKGEHVPSLFNAAKQANPQAWNAFVSGKNWVPELMRFPEFQIDRIIHGTKMPEYINPIDITELTNKQIMNRVLHAFLPGPLPAYADNLGNPAGLEGPQDKREQYQLGRVMSALPMNFPSDAWVMDAGMTELLNEDPDVLYILLGAVDDAGHSFGSAYDLSEWNDKGTPSITDDVSKYDPRASRQGILNVVREADAQVGRLLDLLEKRGTIDQVILVAESDHDMVTCYRKALDMGAQLKKYCKLSPEKDFFFGTAASIGLIATRHNDPGIIPQVEEALEKWQVKNPITGAMECPVIVFNREEMKTGIDKKTGKAWMLPREYYSEYYIEHRKEGEQIWADMLVLTAPNYKFKVENFGLGNLGMSGLPFELPKWGYFIGSHGSFETRPALLIFAEPGAKEAVNESTVYDMDVAPTIYKLMGWPVPNCVDGQVLPQY